MIQIDFSSAKITVDHSSAVPAVSVGGRFASVHLTQGFVSTDVEPKRNKEAFTITGEVDVVADNQSDVDDISNRRWIFNFIQVCKINFFATTWTGRRGGEGEIFLVTSTAPALPGDRRVSLDADSATPFVNAKRPTGTANPLPGGKFKVHVVSKMGDHPNNRILIRPAQNRITRSPNFLFKLESDDDFFTVFIARSPQGILQPPMAHVHWRLSYEARFRWLQGKPRGELRSPQPQFDAFVPGGPTDAAVQGVLANPVPPHTSDLLDEAGRQGVLNHLNLQESAKRSLLVPKDFFL